MQDKSKSLALSQPLYLAPFRHPLVHSNSRFAVTAALFVFLLAYSLILIFSPVLLHDGDTLWHVHIGQWILDHAGVPTVDFYSYTASGKPWISSQWLSEIIFAIAFKAGGWRAVAILTAASCAAVVAFVCFYLLQHLRFSVAIGWTALTAAAISMHFLARPHIFSYIVLVLWSINLLNAYDDENCSLPSWLTLTPLMIVWANLHGSFTLGLLLLDIFAACCFFQSLVLHDYPKCWRLVAVVAVVTVSAFITPYGFSPVSLTVKLLGMKGTISRLSEWRSLDFQQYWPQLVCMVATLSAIAAFGIRLRGPRLLVFIVITYLGFSYARGLVIFFLLAPIILARPGAACASYLAPQIFDPEAAKNAKALDPILSFLRERSVAILASGAALAAIITVSIWLRQDIVPSASMAPKAAIDFVRREHISGNVFNSYQFGGYLIVSGIPTFVDSRAELFGDAFLGRYLDTVNLVDIADAFDTLDQYKVNWVLLLPAEPLTKALMQSPRWEKVFADDYSFVFVRHRE